MSLAEFCIRRPVFVCVLNTIPLIMGVFFLLDLKIQQYPSIQKPILGISIKYPGANQKIIETSVTTPLEEVLSVVEGLKYITSISEAGEGKITLCLEDGVSVDDASTEVRDILAQNKFLLPEGAKDPIVQKTDFNAEPIIYMVLYSDAYDIAFIYDRAKKVLKKSLQTMPGIAKVDTYGGSEYALKIVLDPLKMSAYDIAVSDVHAAIKMQNLNVPSGKLSGDFKEIYISTYGTINTLEGFQEIVVATYNNHLVRLKDVATIKFEPSTESSLASFDGKRAVIIGIVPRPSANPIDVSEMIKSQMPKLQRLLPKNLNFEIAMDRTTFISESIHEVYHTIFEAALFVGIIVLGFLWSFRATLIPLITIPISIIATFIIFHMFNFTINTLTLLAIVLAIGLVVDDAIVVLENVEKYLHKGLSVFQASIIGSSEITFSIIAMTVTLASVYAPLALIKGQVGKFFTEFAVTLAGSIVISGFVSLTLTPVMCSKILAPMSHDHVPDNFVNDAYMAVERLFSSSLRFVLTHRLFFMLGIGAFSAVGLYLGFAFLNQEFMPKEDQGIIYVTAQCPPQTSLKKMQRYMDHIERHTKKIKEIDHSLKLITTPNSKSWEILRGDRKRTSKDIIQWLKPRTESIPGVDVSLASGKSIWGGGSQGLSVSFIMMTSKSHKELQNALESMVSQTLGTRIFSDFVLEQNASIEEYRVSINRDKAAVLSIDPKMIGETMDAIISGRRVGKFNKDDEEFDIVVSVDDAQRRSKNDISSIYLKGGREGGETKMTPITSVTTLDKESSLAQIGHYNQKRSINVTGNILPGFSLGDAMKALEANAKNLPSSIEMEFAGETKEVIESNKSFMVVFMMSLVFIYLILSAQFESLKNPLIIMFSVPLAIAGAFFVLAATNCTMNVYTQIGLITLVGLITKHGILIVDVSNTFQAEGQDERQAVISAAVSRLRPILMTTLAMVIGAIPLLTSSGSGGESRRQIGWTIVGGMSIGTFLTVYVVPIMYTLLGKREKEQDALPETIAEPI